MSGDNDVEVLEVEATMAVTAELAEALFHYNPIVVPRGAQKFWKVENKTYCAAVISSQLKVFILSAMLTGTGKKRL